MLAQGQSSSPKKERKKKKKKDLQRSGGRGDQAVQQGQCWGVRGQGRSAHSERGSLWTLLGHCVERDFIVRAIGTCWRVLRRKMMKSDSVLQRSLCLICRELTVVGARAELGDPERRLLESPKQKMMAAWTKVWATEREEREASGTQH